MGQYQKDKEDYKSLHIVFGDAHANIVHKNTRFEYGSALIMERKPDVILSIGDFADMPSLCTHDDGTKSAIGRLYQDDIDIAVNAQDLLFSGIEQYNKKQRQYGKKTYQPLKCLTLGNHENRINRFVEQHPKFEGKISINDLQYKQHGWVEIPYTDVKEINGVYYTHHGCNKMGFAMSGIHLARNLVKEYHKSITVGHSHLLQQHSESTADGGKLFGLVAGCYLDNDQYERYAGQHNNETWWRGVILKHFYGIGEYDIELISMERLRRLYG